MNKRRSLTAEQLYRNDPRLEVRSAGLRSEARRRLCEGDLAWADIVYVMEREHKSTLRQRFSQIDLPEIQVLEIPDDYDYMDAHLQEMLRFTIDAELRAILSPPGDGG